jgi:hypothetical protein
MDPKKARETLKRLCAEWDRAGQLMNRYVRPAGFSLALGVGVATGAGCSSTLPSNVDAYGVSVPQDGRVDIVDSAKDALPPSPDIYGVLDRPPIPLDGRVNIVDSADDLSYAPDAYGVFDRPPIPLDGRVDIVDSAREALPSAVDAYGAPGDRPRDALPPAVDVYGIVLPRDGGVDSPAVDALLDAADAADAIAALDGADGGAGD